MTRPPESKPATNATPRAWLRTLLLLGVAGGVVLGIAVNDMIGTPAGVNLGGMSNADLIAPIGQHLTAGELKEPQLAAAAKGKDDKKAKSHPNKHQHGKGKADKRHKGKGDKHHKSDKNRKGNKHGEGNVFATAATTSLTFTPVADAQVSEANPTTNYGTLDWLLVDGGADPDVVSYLRLTSPALPPPYSEPRCECGSSPMVAARMAPNCGALAPPGARPD